MQYYRGLAAPAKLAYNAAKTGKINPEDITHRMVQSYMYKFLALALMGTLTYMLTGKPPESMEDFEYANTGDKNPDGTAIRIKGPFFSAFDSWKNQVDKYGILGGTGDFAINQTMIPTSLKDNLGRERIPGIPLGDITDPKQLAYLGKQAAYLGWSTLDPITFENYRRAELKGGTTEKVGAIAGLGMAPDDVDRTPFERKVLATYSELHPPKNTAYADDLLQQYKIAVKNGDTKKIPDLVADMKQAGISDYQIDNANVVYDTPFVEHAWETLPYSKQKALYDSATKADKAKYDLKDED